MFTVVFLESARGALTVSQLDNIRTIAESTEPEIRRHLPMLAPDIQIRVEARGGWEVTPQFGCGATALEEGSLNWIVDPSHSEHVDSIVDTHLRHLLFHECHHLARGWTLSAPRSDRFIDGVVSEGLATAFERDASAVTPPWADYPEDVRQWVDELLPLPASAPYVQWMFFHPDGRHWIGYRAGTYIADQAMAASGRTAAQLVREDTRSILRWGWYQVTKSTLLPNSRQHPTASLASLGSRRVKRQSR